MLPPKHNSHFVEDFSKDFGKEIGKHFSKEFGKDFGPQKMAKIAILALTKEFSKVLCIKLKSSHPPLWWMWPSFLHIS